MCAYGYACCIATTSACVAPIHHETTARRPALVAADRNRRRLVGDRHAGSLSPAPTRRATTAVAPRGGDASAAGHLHLHRRGGAGDRHRRTGLVGGDPERRHAVRHSV